MAIIIVVAALLIGLAARPKADGSSGAVPEAANALRIPIQGAVGSVVEWMRGIYGYIYRYDKLLAENESLRRQLAEAQEQVRSSQDALEENTRLRTMLGYLEKNTTFKTEAAMITSWDASNWTSAFTISKGTDNGIEQGDCVITESGMLVGQVYEVGKNYASVRTTIDVNMDAGVLVGESSIAAMIVGDYALMKEGCCKLSYFTDDVTPSRSCAARRAASRITRSSSPRSIFPCCRRSSSSRILRSSSETKQDQFPAFRYEAGRALAEDPARRFVCAVSHRRAARAERDIEPRCALRRAGHVSARARRGGGAL